VRFRRPKDRRSRPQQWQEAVATLLDCLEAYQAWRDNLPAGVADNALAERLDTVLELRELVEQLEAAELQIAVSPAACTLRAGGREGASIPCRCAGDLPRPALPGPLRQQWGPAWHDSAGPQ
jgi:hypothetical protein